MKKTYKVIYLEPLLTKARSCFLKMWFLTQTTGLLNHLKPLLCYVMLHYFFTFSISLSSSVCLSVFLCLSLFLSLSHFPSPSSTLRLSRYISFSLYLPPSVFVYSCLCPRLGLLYVSCHLLRVCHERVYFSSTHTKCKRA